jgi:hypothetical protein
LRLILQAVAQALSGANGFDVAVEGQSIKAANLSSNCAASTFGGELAQHE